MISETTNAKMFPGTVLFRDTQSHGWCRLIDVVDQGQVDSGWIVNHIKPGQLEDITNKKKTWSARSLDKMIRSGFAYVPNPISAKDWPSNWVAIPSERFTWTPKIEAKWRSNAVARLRNELNIYLETREHTTGRHKIHVTIGESHMNACSPAMNVARDMTGPCLDFELGVEWLPTIRRLIMEGALMHLMDLYQWHRNKEGLMGLLETTPHNQLDIALSAVTGLLPSEMVDKRSIFRMLEIESAAGPFHAPYLYAGVDWEKWTPKKPESKTKTT